MAAIAVIVAIVGFALYNSERAPADAAAKVNSSYLAEERVADRITQYRAASSLEDDADFARALLEQNLNVGTFRQNTINQLALTDLVNARADQLGIAPSEDEAQAQVDAMKQTMAFNDDEIWAESLATYGMSVDSLRAQYLNNLRQQAVLEADVPHREPEEDDVLAYLQENLAGTTQKHASRIVFKGEDAPERATECHERLSEAQAAGSLDAEAFAALAREYSDEEGVEASGGLYAWSSSDAMDNEIMTLLERLEVGAFTGVESIEADGARELIYCDAEYSFPSKDDIASLVLSDVPETLMPLVEDAAADVLWTADCNAYLLALLSAAQITYYPIPADAAYAVDMALAS
jgi:parvulin-like peptidyl-prolyl isomerase